MIENITLRTELAKKVVEHAIKISEPLHDYDWQEMIEEIIERLQCSWER
tara:strand:- start:356 stop:502 length:147 start_codon:yes stop_codon:yes gene_type:complete